MAEQLKTFFSPALVRRLSGDIARVHPAFDSRAFIRDATRGLDDLELLDRGKHIARALAKHLPQDYAAAIDVLLRSLGPEHATDELVGVGMGPFFYLPHTLFVAERGLDHFELSMKAQYELTKRFSAEGSIRPFIARYPDRTLGTLRVNGPGIPMPMSGASFQKEPASAFRGPCAFHGWTRTRTASSNSSSC